MDEVDTQIAALFAQVYAEPDDDELRHILADALMARSDPRGELILYQLRPEADHPQRAMRLVQQHGLSWLGPLRDVVIPLAYERGFLASAQVLVTARANLTRACGEWATVHTLELDANDAKVMPEMIPVMRSLRALHRVNGAVLHWLGTCALPTTLATLHVTKRCSPDSLSALPRTVRQVFAPSSYHVRDDDGAWVTPGGVAP
ncbi:MAG: hypothetical protein NT062_37335 [Proteobacteria bacterium]|nr:hypothetical protein [Pseudomonadota bacterium]